MRPGGRIQAAAEVLEDIFSRHQPAATACRTGQTASFRGLGDRAAIGTLVYDVLRRWLSLGAQMGSDAPRALAVAAASKALGLSVADVAAVCDGGPHAPAPLSDDEQARLAAGLATDVPPYVAADVPEWVMPSFTRAFGARAIAEGRAMAERAPIDLRPTCSRRPRDKW